MVQLKRKLDDEEAQLVSTMQNYWKCPECAKRAAASPGKNEDTPVKNEYTRFLVPAKNEDTLGPKDG